MTQGAPPDVARCISGKIVGAYSIEDLYSADPAQFQTQEFFDQVRGFAETCDARGVTRGGRYRLVGSDALTGLAAPLWHVPDRELAQV